MLLLNLEHLVRDDFVVKLQNILRYKKADLNVFFDVQVSFL